MLIIHYVRRNFFLNMICVFEITLKETIYLLQVTLIISLALIKKTTEHVLRA